MTRTSQHPAAALILAGVLATAPAAAQDERRERREGDAGAGEAARGNRGRPAGEDDEGGGAQLRPGDVRISADWQNKEGGHYMARGFVDLVAGETRIQADALDLYEEPTESGATSRRLEAEGNVVFMRGEERLSGDRMVLDMDTNTGRFDNAVGYIEPGVFIEGQLIERLDAGTYRITGGKFTSCSQPNPRWGFTASSATVQLNDKIKAKNVVFKVKKVPTLYLPYLIYPIKKDERSTGLLMPDFGYGSERGYKLGTGFFWAMGRSYDQTFYFDHYSRFGQGYGHEFRFLRESPSRGTFRTYFFRLSPELQESTGREWDYDFNWTGTAQLPGKVRADVRARLFSNQGFQQQMQYNLNSASVRRQQGNVTLRRSFGATSLQLLADTRETIWETSDTERIHRRLPSFSVRRSSRKIARTGIAWSLEASAERLSTGDQERVEGYSRYDIAPEVARPFSTQFLQVTPRFGLRYTRYGNTLDEDNEIAGPGVDRKYMEASVQVRGPDFSRVFVNPGIYAERIKHVIGPEFVWRYRSQIDDFDEIPKFDGKDYFLGTNEMRYGLVNKFLAKVRGPGGKLRNQEFLNWRVYQTYYMNIDDGQNNYDRSYSSSSFQSGGASHFSPLRSRLRFRPTRGFNTTFDVEYDVTFKRVRAMSVGANVRSGVFTLRGNWSRRKRYSSSDDAFVTRADFIRGGVTLDPLPGLQLAGTADYDIMRKDLLRASGRARWGVQCCGVMVEVIQYDYNQRVEREINFSIELANLGSFGNFMDGGQAGRQRR